MRVNIRFLRRANKLELLILQDRTRGKILNTLSSPVTTITKFLLRVSRFTQRASLTEVHGNRAWRERLREIQFKILLLTTRPQERTDSIFPRERRRKLSTETPKSSRPRTSIISPQDRAISQLLRQQQTITSGLTITSLPETTA